MLTNFKSRQLLLLVLFIASPVMADQAPAASDPEKFINIRFEFHGLNESNRPLKEASLDLAERLSQIDPDPEDMTPEQLQALASVIQEANHLIQSIDDSINEASPAIKNLVADALTAVQQSSIEPTIQSVDDSVSKWLIITLVGVFLLVAASGYFFYQVTSQIRATVKTLKSISEEYELVPKRAALEKTNEE
jgi:hypothetical protein